MRVTWAVCSVCVLLCTPLVAHHSFGDMYLESDSVEIEGTIVEFQYKNPHAWVFVEAPDPFGQEKIYGAEWVSTSQLERAGISKSTLKAGDRVPLKLTFEMADGKRETLDVSVEVRDLTGAHKGH